LTYGRTDSSSTKWKIAAMFELAGLNSSRLSWRVKSETDIAQPALRSADWNIGVGGIVENFFRKLVLDSMFVILDATCFASFPSLPANRYR